MIVGCRKLLFLACIGDIASNEQLQVSSASCEYHSMDNLYLWAEIWVFEHDGGVAELLHQAVFALDCCKVSLVN